MKQRSLILYAGLIGLGWPGLISDPVLANAVAPATDLADVLTTADPLQGVTALRTTPGVGGVRGEAIKPTWPRSAPIPVPGNSPLPWAQTDGDQGLVAAATVSQPLSQADLLAPKRRLLQPPVVAVDPGQGIRTGADPQESGLDQAADLDQETPARATHQQAILAQADQGNSAAPPDDDDLDQLPRDPELGVIRVRNPLEDPELGILRIRQQPDILSAPPPAPPSIGFFSARFSAVSSDNILLIVNDVGGLTGGTFYRPAATFAVYPNLGPETALIGAIDVGLQRYSDQPSINYNDWRARLGIRQGLSPRTYGQLNLTYQELFRAESGFRFFDNKSVGLTLGRRDPLTPDLVLDSYYQLQYNDARSRSATSSGIMATDFSRWSQVAGAYLGYTINPQWHTGVSYQINLIDYTIQDRYDTLQQVLGQLVYSLTPRVRLSLYGGLSFGRSSDPRVRFNDTIFGVTIDATVPLF